MEFVLFDVDLGFGDIDLGTNCSSMHVFSFSLVARGQLRGVFFIFFP